MLFGHPLGPSIGAPAKARVHITAALDLTCPFSKRALQTLKALADKYPTSQVQISKLDWVQVW